MRATLVARSAPVPRHLSCFFLSVAKYYRCRPRYPDRAQGGMPETVPGVSVDSGPDCRWLRHGIEQGFIRERKNNTFRSHGNRDAASSKWQIQLSEDRIYFCESLFTVCLGCAHLLQQSLPDSSGFDLAASCLSSSAFSSASLLDEAPINSVRLESSIRRLSISRSCEPIVLFKSPTCLMREAARPSVDQFLYQYFFPGFRSTAGCQFSLVNFGLNTGISS